MRMRRKPNLAARISRCSDYLITEPGALRGSWLNKFGFAELHIEIGCGKGRFTVESAKAEPEVLFAALEKTDNVLVIALERAAEAGLGNIRYINAYADYLTDYFAPGEASRIYLNFCDPWPASRHAKRRLTCRRYLELYSQVLCPGGEIHFKTDNLPLFEFSLSEFELCGYTLLDITRDLHRHGPVGVMTDYEQKFHSQGTAIHSAILTPFRPGAQTGNTISE